MCILIFKKYWLKNLPNKEELENCYQTNKDWIWVWIANWKKTYLYKYDNLDDFLKLYKRIKKFKKLKELSIMIHFRYRTSWPINKGLNHPYILTSRDDIIKNTWITQSPIIWHNWVLNLKDYQNNEKENDTIYFIKNYLSNNWIRKNLKDSVIKKLIENYINNNKILILYPNHKYIFLNEELWHYKNKIWYSNYNYTCSFSHYSFLNDFVKE